MGRVNEVRRTCNPADFVVSDADRSAELAAEALLALIDITEILPYIIRIDLYGGIFSFYDRKLRF